MSLGSQFVHRRQLGRQLLSLVVTLLIASPSFAIDLIDPQSKLERLGQRLGTTSWSSVQCGERQSFFRSQTRCESKCSAHMCVDQCTDATSDNNTFDLQIEDCTAEQVAIYGTNNFEAYVQRADFERTGTWIVAFINNLEHFTRPVTEVEINSVHGQTVTIIENGKMRKELGVSVLMDLRSQKGSMGRTYEMVFVSRSSLLGGLVYFGSLHNEFFLKKKGVASVR
jgi:hypothetical protein